MSYKLWIYFDIQIGFMLKHDKGIYIQIPFVTIQISLSKWSKGIRIFKKEFI